MRGKGVFLAIASFHLEICLGLKMQTRLLSILLNCFSKQIYILPFQLQTKWNSLYIKWWVCVKSLIE